MEKHDIIKPIIKSTEDHELNTEDYSTTQDAFILKKSLNQGWLQECDFPKLVQSVRDAVLNIVHQGKTDRAKIRAADLFIKTSLELAKENEPDKPDQVNITLPGSTMIDLLKQLKS